MYGDMYSFEYNNIFLDPYYCFDIPYYEKKQDKKYFTEYYINHNRFITYEKKFTNYFITSIKLLHKKYNINNDISDNIWYFLNLNDSDKNSKLIDLCFNFFEYKLVRVIDTYRGYPDDFEKYEINNNKIVHITFTLQGYPSFSSSNKCYICCKNDKIIDIKYDGSYNFNICPFYLNGPSPKLEDIKLKF